MSYITIDRANFTHNLNVIKSHLDSIKVAKNIEFGAVLKDNAYGHGLEIMASLCAQNGVKNAFVKNYAEAALIADKFEHISFFYGILPRDFNPKFRNIYPCIQSVENVVQMRSLGDLSGIGVELKVNIGMNRNGAQISEIKPCIKAILESKMRLIGVFSHNGYADDNGDEFMRECVTFDELKAEVTHLANVMGFKLPRFHSLNSAGALRSKRCDDDLVRIGIAMYGYLTNDVSIESSKDLKPILRLYAEKIATKILKKGAKIGYGGSSILQDDSVVSSYDIGYGDGFYRVNERREVRLPNGVQILPKSSMDCFSALSDAETLCVMDNADYIARIYDTIAEEVLTRLSPYIKRMVV